MSLTEAMEEAYAANPHGESVIETVELNHPTFDEPVRVASGVDDDITLPLELGGEPVLFKAIGFSAVLPGASEDEPTPMKLRVNDANGVLTPYLKAAVGSTWPIEVTYRAYTTTELTRPGDVIGRLFLSDVDQDASGAEGALTFQEIELQAFPLATYDQTYYPMLQNP